ncbi:MAG: discoidin domain-containing protein, partial [Bacteroidota bacterium]
MQCINFAPVSYNLTEVSTQTADGSSTDDCYEITRTWEATDHCGQVSTSTQTITVEDNSVPVLADVPADVTVTTVNIPAAPKLNCTGENLALNKTATQSSDNGGAASRAVDGNTDGNFATGSVSLTTAEFQPWWQVDLDSVKSIDSIEIWNRTDCCSGQLSNYYLLISDFPFASTDLATTLTDPNVTSYFQTAAAGSPSTIGVDTTARYVRIQLQGTDVLSLAEVVVRPTCVTASDNCDANVTVTMTEVISPINCDYTITRTWEATDNCGNVFTRSQVISVSSILQIEANITSDYNTRDISCATASDGTASVTVTGGVAPITYAWSTGATSATVNGLSANKYLVTVTDNNGCMAVDSVTLLAPPGINVNTNVTSDFNGEAISCYGLSDGQGFASATGGTGLLSYAWSNGQTGQNLLNVSAGTYTVTVTDVNGCTATEILTINQPDALDLSPTVTTDYNGSDISCSDASDAGVTVGVLGGVEPYTYAWGGGETSVSINGLSANTYNVTVTDANGCQKDTFIIVTQPDTIALSLNVTTNYNGSDVSCNGAADGAATVSATGGVGAYTYAWDTGETGTDITNKTAGTYYVSVTDANGCMVSDSIVIEEPVLMSASIDVTSDFSGFSVSCNGATDGSAATNVSGGTGSYTYSWSNGFTTDTLVNVGANTYGLTVTDANGCTIATSVTLTEPPVLQLDNVSSSDPLLCEGTDGSIIVTVSGGIGRYEYRIDTSATVWQRSNVYSNLSAGNYNIFVRDTIGNCQIGPINVVLTDPIPRACPITSDANPGGVCSSDIAVAFKIDTLPDANSYTWTVPAGMIISSGQGTDSISVNVNNVATGTYQVSVVTNSNCGVSSACIFNFDVIGCVEICDNGIDDDADGLTDCDDPDCFVTAEINFNTTPPSCPTGTVTYVATNNGTGSTYTWDFGSDATPATATGPGPHDVVYTTCGNKTISLLVEKDGCSSTDSETYLVEDNTNPVWTTNPSDLTIECDGTFDPGGQIASWLSLNGNGVTMDNCDTLVVSHDYTGFDQACGVSGDTLITFTATDACGN